MNSSPNSFFFYIKIPKLNFIPTLPTIIENKEIIFETNERNTRKNNIENNFFENQKNQK